MIIREVQAGDEMRWDEYVRNSPYSTPQHLFAWKQIMEKAFNSKTYYLLAEENGKLQGILPLIHVKSLLAGNYMTSQPGGICAENDRAACLLFEYAKELVKAQKSKYLILRDGRNKWDLPGTMINDEHVTFLVDVPIELKVILRVMKKRNRQIINQFYSNGMMGKVEIENLNEYYPVYQRAMREIGTPTLGADFFNMTASLFPGELNLVTIQNYDEIIGGGFIHPIKETVFCLWSGLLHEHYKHHPSYLLIWECIKYANSKGYQSIDLGRCRKNSGGYIFKRGFGGKELQLYQQIYLNGTSQAPHIGGERKDDVTYRLFTSFWRLIPLPVTEVLGPFLRKQMPFG